MAPINQTPIGPSGNGPEIRLQGLSKAFTARSHNDPVLDSLTLTIDAGEFCTVFGPNGSGKTTFLNIIAGVLRADEGVVLVGGKQPALGGASYVFQNFKDALFPWRTAEGNLLFPLEQRVVDAVERRERLNEFLARFPLPIPLRSRVYELSIGQQQMVGIARALVCSPQLLLLDEPFSALDWRSRRTMQDWLLGYSDEHTATIVFVSHEIDEAVYLGDRLLVFPPKPVKEIRELAIDQPRNRKRDFLFTGAAQAIRAEAIRYLDSHEGTRA